jgi:NADPH:quinone reductase-like Zn-dependent oxidoreductase
MRALVISDGGLTIATRPAPKPSGRSVLVRVAAAGINTADLAQVAGWYPAPPGSPPDIPGLEFAGVVVERGPDVGRVDVGDRVMALVGGGAQAELALVDERHLLPVPATLPWPAAGGFMEAFATAHDALFSQGALQANERVLIQGAAGGVGVAAVQLAVAAGAEVVATARTRRTHDRLAALGATVAPLDDPAVLGPYDVILELIGGEGFGRDVTMLARRGRLLVIGSPAGSRAEVDFGQLMMRYASIHASTLRSRSAEEKEQVVAALERTVLPLLVDGRLKVPVHAAYRLEDAIDAYQGFARPGKFGKFVLTTAAA